jgi:hypothetical protein
MPSPSEADVMPMADTPTPGLRHYTAYGLGIASEFALPELEAASGEAGDVIIRRRRIDRPLPVDAPTAFAFDADAAYLGWQSAGAFLIRDAREIDVDPKSGVGEQVLRLPLLGPVLAVLLHLRGLLVLHASAVAIGGRCVVFLGDKHAGKSTTAAALLRAGHRLVADDIVAIDASRTPGPQILPGFPQLKLDAASPDLAGAARVMPPPVPGFAKRQHRLTGAFSHAPVAASRFCVLSRGKRAAFTPLEPKDALAALLRFSYVARFGQGLLNGAAAAAHFSQCAQIVNRSEVGRLEVPDDIDALDSVARWIEDDLTGRHP